MKDKFAFRVEWPTLVLVLVTYVLWLGAVFWLSAINLPLAIFAAGVLGAFHSSLTHEAIHGHPFAHRRLNEALVFPALSLFVPYSRFRDTHIAHHGDTQLTDPYDDPESNFLDGADWDRMPAPLRAVLRFNNTLVGRLIVGPLVGHAFWLRGDLRAILAGDGHVLRGWLWHVPAVAVVLWVVALSPMPVWAILVAGYVAMALLKIRTFLEHRAHEETRARTVIIEDRGPLALLFLNNNLHAVHHALPGVPWYRLRGVYEADREGFLGRNEGYRFGSYAEVFARHFLRAKDPVAHPLWRRG